MSPQTNPIVFLGAGASAPAGLPTFQEIWHVVGDGLVERPPTEWDRPPDPQSSRLEDILQAAGTDSRSVLAGLMVSNSEPAIAHTVAVRVLSAGGDVASVNWDDCVERAAASLSVNVHVIRAPEPWCDCALPHLYKLHGEPHSAAVPLFAAKEVVKLPDEWAQELPELFADRPVAIYGYSGRDGDVWTPLVAGINSSQTVDWFTLPDRESGLREVLKSEIDDGVVKIHANDDPGPLLEAWAKSLGIKPCKGEPLGGVAVKSGTLLTLTPAVLGLIPLLSARPEQINSMDDRAFEELTAALLAEQGYDIELTQRSKDGGVDVAAARRDPVLGDLRYLVQCKRHSLANKVKVGPVRELYGVVSARNATGGLVVTSGFFSRGAKAFAGDMSTRMTLHDHETFKAWLAGHHQ